MTRRTRTFEQVSDSDLFQQIASQHSLQASLDVSGPTHKIIAQVNQSDLALVRERARSIDAEVWIDGTTLHVQSRAARQTGNLALTYGEGLQEFAVTADLASQASGFTVTGWDVSGKQKISHRATSSVITGEAGNDTVGSGILDQAIGTREQQVVHALPLTTDEAQAAAEAYYRRAARRFVTGHGVAEGDARLRVGTRLTLSGLGALFEGKYYVTRVRHTFDTVRGFRTAFAVERPGVAA
jgi:phage protein D